MPYNVSERGKGQELQELMLGRYLSRSKKSASSSNVEAFQMPVASQDHPSDIIARFDRYGQYIHTSRGYETLLGVSSRELYGKRPTDVASSLDGKFLEQKVRALIQSGRGEDFEHICIRKDGGKVYTFVSFTPKFNTKRELVYIQSRFNYIAELTESKKRMRLLDIAMKNAKEGVYLIDRQFDIIYVNTAACKMLGYTPDEFLEMSVFDIEALYEKSGIIDKAKHTKHSENRFETKHRKKDGTLIDVEVTSSRFYHNHRELYLSIVKDITQQKSSLQKLREREQEFRTLADNLPDNVVRWDHEGRIVYVNTIKLNMLKLRYEDVIGKTTTELFGENRFTAIEDGIKRVFATQKPVLLSKKSFLMPNGITEIHDIRLIPEFNEQNRLIGVLGVGRDMTDYYTLQNDIIAKEQELRMLTESSPGMAGSLHMRSDGSFCIPYASSKLHTLFGLEHSEVVNDASPFFALIHPQEHDALKQSLIESAHKKTMWHQYFKIQHPKDGERWMEGYSNPLPHPQGGTIWYGYIRDITEHKEAEKKIEFLAYYDELTRLPNRFLAKERCIKMISQAKKSTLKVALMLINLDGFKNINNSVGHDLGDDILKAVALRLQLHTRTTDLLSRQGGDEFLLSVANIASIDEVSDIARKIVKIFKDPFEHTDEHYAITASIGIAVYPNDSESFEALLQKSDIAMSQAKANGKNGFFFYDSNMDSDLPARMHIKNRILNGILQEEFYLQYQPQIEIQTGRIVGVEALVRWRHPDLGVVAPDDFIQVAEESGLIVELGEWILSQACAQAAKWIQNGIRLVVAVNISAVQFWRKDFVDIVSRVLQESGLSPNMLELEMTETIMMRTTEKTLSKIQTLKGMGITLSIDDFGTGYSSLAYLKRFAVDKLKIDRSFILDLSGNKENIAIVKAIIDMARTLNLKTIAEGVEEQRTAELLAAYGCNEIQGFYYAQPMDTPELEQFYADHTSHEKSHPA